MTQDTALDILKTGANVFLTGEPGSGKTYTVNSYIRYLKQHDISPSITASTGIAATHVSGMTIHSWSGIGIKRYLTAQDLDEMGTREPLVKRILASSVLIIDEVSMLDGKILAMVDLVTKSIRRSDEPFGGLQVILVGDFFQLPPISGYGEAPAQFCFETDVWELLNPMVCYLSEQHRQEDVTFLSTLTAIRRGELEDSVYECLEDRRTSPEEYPEGVPQLYTHNIDVDLKNSQALSLIESQTHRFEMLTQGKKNLIEQMKKGCLSPETLELKEGASVMFTKNNFDAGYVNGTLGVVQGFDEETGFPQIETRDGETITALPSEWAIEDEGKVVAKLTQIPLRLAWAITVHKSQGMSMDAAIMDLSRAFEYGQGYVALSRVRRLSGLHLVGINTRAFAVHPLVLEHDRVFREQSLLATSAFESIGKEELSLMHRNFIRSLGGSDEEIVNDDSEITMKSGNTARIHSREETRALVDQQLSINKIIQIRNLSHGTILKHIEELCATENPPSIEYLKKEIPTGLLAQVRSAIENITESDEVGKLTPIKKLLGDNVSYEDIRIARLLISLK